MPYNSKHGSDIIDPHANCGDAASRCQDGLPLPSRRENERNKNQPQVLADFRIQFEGIFGKGSVNPLFPVALVLQRAGGAGHGDFLRGFFLEFRFDPFDI